MRPEEFWSLWPQRFDLLRERHMIATKSADFRAGMLMALFFNANRNQEAHPHGKEWTDFFPQWEEEPEEQTEDQMLDAMMMWANATAPLAS